MQQKFSLTLRVEEYFETVQCRPADGVAANCKVKVNYGTLESFVPCLYFELASPQLLEVRNSIIVSLNYYQ